MLHRAARVGDHDTIRSLASAGADLNEIFDIGLDPGATPTPATPLMVAAGSGDGASVETVLLLLRLGADPTVVVAGCSAASFACVGLGRNYRPNVDGGRLQALLDAGSPLNVTGKRGNRIACQVARQGEAELLHMLLERGADAGARDNQERTALWYADVAQMIDLRLSQGLSLEDRDEYDWTPLDDAACDGPQALRRLEALIEVGADATRRATTAGRSSCQPHPARSAIAPCSSDSCRLGLIRMP